MKKKTGLILLLFVISITPHFSVLSQLDINFIFLKINWYASEKKVDNCFLTQQTLFKQKWL